MEKKKKVSLQNLAGIILLVGGAITAIPFFLQEKNIIGIISTAAALIGLVLITLHGVQTHEHQEEPSGPEAQPLPPIPEHEHNNILHLLDRHRNSNPHKTGKLLQPG